MASTPDRKTSRPIAIGLSLAALALVAACGRGDPDPTVGSAAPDSGETLLAEAQPGPRPGSDPGPDAVPDIRPDAQAAEPLNLDFSTETAEITVTLPREAAADPALYAQLAAEAEAEAKEAQAIAAEDAAMRADSDFPFHGHFLTIEWRTDFASDEVLSLLRTTALYQGGAHPNTYFDVLNWDRAAQAPLGAADLFADAAWPALSSLAESALMVEKRGKLGDGLSDEDYWRRDIIMATAPAAENFGLFTLVPAAGDASHAGGIALHYPPYAVGPYVEGDYHIVIPQAAFAEYIKPERAGLFAGDPATPRGVN